MYYLVSGSNLIRLMLKRYLVFDYGDYYPGGGWNDFVGSFDSLEEARASEHREIVDTQTGERVS